MGNVTDVSEADFEERVLEQSGKVPVLVDFWAPTCPPCLMLGPVLERIAGEYGGKLAVVKINVDENRALSQRYGITGIPAVKLFRNREVVDGFLGLKSEETIREWLDKSLGGDAA